ncbi:MAG: O-methyltransferase [Elainellaceae cyanobacterium]
MVQAKPSAVFSEGLPSADQPNPPAAVNPAAPSSARPVTPQGILVRQIEAAIAVAQETEAAAPLLSSLRQVQALASGFDPYIKACTTPESDDLAALAHKTAAEDWAARFSNQETVQQLEQEMLSGHVEGQTLKLFVQMIRAKRILEVGLFTGYSALAMAEALPEDGCLVACEVDPYAASFARDCFDASAHGHKIQIKVAPALETLKALIAQGQRFDLVFVDADKREYIDYFNCLMDGGLIAPGGYICVDNTLLQGQPYLSPSQQTPNGAAIAAFNRAVAADPRVDQVLLPLRDGLTVIRRKV